MVLGSTQFRARSVEPQDRTRTAGSKQKVGAQQKEAVSSAESPAEKAVDEEARSMIIRVLDDQSQPLEGVDVYVTGIDYDRNGGIGKSM